MVKKLAGLKKIINCIVIVQLLLLVSGMAVAQFQPAPVVRSQEKTIVNGKIYYIHTVQKGQTAYSISKAYDVTVEDIKNANPQVDILYLVEGLAIRIPESKPKQIAVYPENRDDFYAHTIKRKETIYSLSKKYNVDEEVIYHYNPWAKEGIKQDQTLWIPRKKEMHDISAQTASNEGYYYYTVKEKDTLYSIALIYGVNVSDIIDANPELRDGLKSGIVLKIPKNKAPQAEQLVLDTMPELPCAPPEQPVTYNIALMLPLFASYNKEVAESATDTIAEEGTYVPHRQQGLKGRNFAEFYEGFILAVDSLKQTGLSVNLHVFDTERDTMKIKKIIRELSSIHPDLIVGPVYSDDVNITGRFAGYQGISLVSPLSTRSSLVNNNGNIIQIIPSNEAESYAIANYLKQYKKGRIILLRGTDSLSMRNSWRFKKYLMENMPADESGNPLYFKDYRLNDSLRHQLGKILSKEEENLIVVFSDKEPDVSLLVTRLIQMPSYPVVLFGMPSWQSFTNIDLPFFHSLQIHLITPFYTDYSSPAIKRFLYKSRISYGYEPYEISSLGYNYSMLGYDIGLYFMSALKQYGRNFLSCVNQINTNQLLTKYHFQKAGSGGYVNINYNVIEYREDFSIEKLSVVSGEPVIHPGNPEPVDVSVPLFPVQ
jgi:LysM repeat protein/ABC-type branched-subunit amino acid transport system substrate-binding protein